MDYTSHIFKEKNTFSELFFLHIMLNHNLDYLVVAQLNIFHILWFSVQIMFQRFHSFFIYAKSSVAVSIFKMECVLGNSCLSVAFGWQQSEFKKYTTWRHLDTMTFFCIPYFKRCSTWINHLPSCLIHLSFNFLHHGFSNFHFRWKRQGFFKLFCNSCTILLLKLFIQVLSNKIVLVLQRSMFYQPKFLCLFDVKNIFL